MRILGKSEDFDDFLIKNMIFSLKTLWVRSITYGSSRRARTDPGPLTSDQGHRMDMECRNIRYGTRRRGFGEVPSVGNT